MSDSSIRTKPSIDDPSNIIWPSRASLELPVGDLDVLDDAEDVGELQAQEPDAGRAAVVEHLALLRGMVGSGATAR